MRASTANLIAALQFLIAETGTATSGERQPPVAVHVMPEAEANNLDGTADDSAYAGKEKGPAEAEPSYFRGGYPVPNLRKPGGGKAKPELAGMMERRYSTECKP